MLAELMFYRHDKTSVSIQQQKENLCHFYCFPKQLGRLFPFFCCDGDGVSADLGFVKYEIDFCSFLKLIPGVKSFGLCIKNEQGYTTEHLRPCEDKKLKKQQ